MFFWEPLQGTALFFAQAATTDVITDRLGEFFGAEELKETAAADADDLGDGFPGSVAELRFQGAEGGGAINGVEVVADDVLHELLDETAILGDIADDGRDDSQTSRARGAEAALAVEHDVDVEVGVIADGDRLQDALAADTGGKLFQALGIEGSAGLIGVGDDALEPDLLGGWEVFDADGLGAMVGKEGIDGKAATALGR